MFDCCVTCLIVDAQFARTEGGVCGPRGRRARWPVARGRSREYDTAMLLCHSWEAETVRAVEERPRAALPSHVPVSISSCEGKHSKAASPLQWLAYVPSSRTSLVPCGSPKATFPMCFRLSSCQSWCKRWSRSVQYVRSCSIKFQAYELFISCLETTE